MDTKTVTSIVLPSRHIEELRALRSKTGRSLSDLVREAVSQWLARPDDVDELVELDVADLMSESDAAVWLGISPRSMREARLLGAGPTYVRHLGSVYYRREELESWSQTPTIAEEG